MARIQCRNPARKNNICLWIRKLWLYGVFLSQKQQALVLLNGKSSNCNKRTSLRSVVLANFPVSYEGFSWKDFKASIFPCLVKFLTNTLLNQTMTLQWMTYTESKCGRASEYYSLFLHKGFDSIEGYRGQFKSVKMWQRAPYFKWSQNMTYQLHGHILKWLMHTFICLYSDQAECLCFFKIGQQVIEPLRYERHLKNSGAFDEDDCQDPDSTKWINGFVVRTSPLSQHWKNTETKMNE